MSSDKHPWQRVGTILLVASLVLIPVTLYGDTLSAKSCDNSGGCTLDQITAIILTTLAGGFGGGVLLVGGVWMITISRRRE